LQEIDVFDTGSIMSTSSKRAAPSDDALEPALKRMQDRNYEGKLV
jgi:hypothetical protein